MYKKYFDAHFHWFDHSAFSDRLSSNIGDLDTKEYFLETYGRMASIIVLVWIRLHAPMI